jgi:Uncharacterized protein conserved in bacteria
MDHIIKNLDYSKATYMFDGITDGILPADIVKTIRSFIATENLYLSATREIGTKLENLNNEFKYTKDRNPIHLIKTRVKTPKSILEKLQRRRFELTVESARENITDIAGIRVICPYIDDIYLIADMLTKQDDIELIHTSDYIRNPKQNGYRSLHLIVTVPVFLSNRKEIVKAEVQIRTIAMDFWASLEHELAYKLADNKTGEVIRELKECADIIADTDKRMQNLFNITVNPINPI